MNEDRWERWLRALDRYVSRVGWVVIALGVIWFAGSVALHVI